MQDPRSGPSTGTLNSMPQKSATITRGLLACGVIAGPVYVLVGGLQILTRPGFDMTRHDLSLMSNGDLGWIQIANFVVTGLLTLACAFGMRRVLSPGRGRIWGPLLLAGYGVGLIAAGAFVADPALGFPPGTPADAHSVSWHGLLHLISGSVGFLSLIAACIVFARRFARLGQRGWAAYSMATGVIFFAAFLGIAAGSSRPGSTMAVVILAFTAAVVLAWTWISTLAARIFGGMVA
jgi:Protein of unknown function (DUF998)